MTHDQARNRGLAHGAATLTWYETRPVSRESEKPRKAFWRVVSGLMRVLGLPLGHAWTPGSYQAFLKADGFSPRKREVMDSTFPLSYVECEKKGEARS